jgi:hypothetical protein
VAIILFALPGGDNPSQSDETWFNIQTYNVGEPGPAGGIVFYDKGDYDDGWRYLEAASVDLPDPYQWGFSGDFVGCTRREIGAGEDNTGMYIARFGGGTGFATDMCVAYEQNGYDDWFLPSLDELIFIGELGVLGANDYWSSTEDSPNDVFAYNASTLVITASLKETIFNPVRPARRF